MIVKHRLNLDLIKRGVPQRLDVVQDDCNSRQLEIRLFANGVAFAPPEDCTVYVRYKKPDGTGGTYDSLSDGTSAWSISDGVLYVMLAPQVCTVAGTVELAVTLMVEKAEISTFMLLIDVEAAPGGNMSSRDYVNITAFIPQPTKAEVGQLLMVAEVDTQGRVTVITAEESDIATLELTAAEALPAGAKPTVTEEAGSTNRARKYKLGIPKGETPQKGVDYYTEADKTELVNAVLAALPTWEGGSY